MTKIIRRRKKTEIVLAQPTELAKNPVAVLLAKYPSAHSRRAALDSLRLFCKWMKARDPVTFPWASLTYAHVQALRAKLIESYQKPATCRRHLSMLKNVMKECWRLELISTEVYRRIEDIEGISGETLPAGRALDSDEVRALFEACGDLREYEGARDSALLACAYYAGLRHEELTALQLHDFDPGTGDLKIFGKGRKEREVRLANRGRMILIHWLAIRGTSEGQLILGPFRRPLTYSYVTSRIESLCLKAGVKRFTPHDLRRTFVTRIIERTGGDVKTAKDLAGHAKLETTIRYDRRNEEVKRQAAALLDD